MIIIKVKFIIVLLLAGVLLMSGCTFDAGKIIGGASQEDVEKISGAVISCETPYIRHGAECCLDKDDNKICDVDEGTETPPAEEEPAEVEPEPASDCAAHFTKVNSSELPICGGGSMGGSPITDAYGCKADPNYPAASSCPAGTGMNNTYGSAAGSTPTYTCYVSQSIGATSAPAGCPISAGTITCASGFVYDATPSKLTWTGGGSAWGCFFRCKAQPDPYVANSDWPCTKTGYKPIGGGGGSTCCAKW